MSSLQQIQGLAPVRGVMRALDRYRREGMRYPGRDQDAPVRQYMRERQMRRLSGGSL